MHKHVKLEQDLSLILEGSETALQNRFLIPTQCFQSRAPGEIKFQGLSSGDTVPLEESFQGLGLGDSQREAPKFMREIIQSFRENVHIKV